MLIASIFSFAHNVFNSLLVMVIKTKVLVVNKNYQFERINFAVHNWDRAEIMRLFFEQAENIVGKGKNCL